MLERTKVIPLSKNLEDKTQKTAWEQIELREPALMEVEQFYDKESKTTVLSAMRLLISLVSGVPESVLGRMAYSDYKQCEEYLMGFLTHGKQKDGGN
ncbi:phage tail assembly protein [Brenneria corticis]|uniref:Phage tail assembly protein n=1 Tax=Brenneria corticis TaxID=2173106 RepID=A0A2U1TU93_9GAMM|nr:phage tail assembly protein [Brenneria sp. CFCC 11842]